MAETSSAAIEERARALARRGGELWQQLKEDARNYYRTLARKQLESEAG